MKNVYGVLLTLLSLPALAEGISLQDKMMSLDSELFASFNHCQDPEQLAKHAGYFAADVEFYHDNGGVTWDRDTMISNTKNNVCGKFTRKLVAGSFKAYPIKGFGAITEGEHLFCQAGTEQCEGKADFVMVWHNVNNKWQVTRVLSFGHRENH
ncbi:nuclear transport factor 2 family protein [Neptunicella sp.]|uniref:nuclear transport factor 2 family protein n=1 Tax=Neptunicella sp. TaxID=2125986 RepID=UPI003F692AB4